MNHNHQSMLEYWFANLDKKIDPCDSDLVIAEIQLRALKDGIDPNNPEVLAIIRPFQAEVKTHNKPFNDLKLLEEQNVKFRAQLAILTGQRTAKSASQRAFLAAAKKVGVELKIRESSAKLESLEVDRNGNPAYPLSKLLTSTPKPKHHQFQDIPDKPDWVRIECAGGGGRHVGLRKKKVSFASDYVCDSVLSGQPCKANLPSAEPGQIRSTSLNSTGSFTGINDEWPTPAQQASANRARGYWLTELHHYSLTR
jgi:hypothetical protein